MLAKDAASTTADAAFGSLFSLWGAAYQPGGGVACDQALAHGLSCVWQRGSFAQLKLINRPAILSLVDAEGAAHQVVLPELGEERRAAARRRRRDARAGRGTRRLLVRRVPRAVAAAGRRAAPAARRDARRRRALAARRASSSSPACPATADGDYFDAELQQLVENFQRSRRLAVDGIAGLQTQLVLDSALGMPGTPTLAQAGPQAGA